MIIPWQTMPPSGLAIRQALIRGDGILLGIIAAMAGMEVGTTPGIHLIIIVVGAMAGTILGSIPIMVTMAIMAGTIHGIMAITAIPIIMAIPTGEVADIIMVAAMPIITTSVQVLSVQMVLLTPIVMETLCRVIAVALLVFATVPVE